MSPVRNSLLLVMLVGCSSTPRADEGAEAAQPKPTVSHVSFSLPPPSDVLPPDLAALVDQLSAKNPDNRAVAASIAASGNEVARKRAGARLAAIADQLGGRTYREGAAREIEQSNQRLGRHVTPQQLEELVDEMQMQALAPVYLAMLEVGGEAAIEHGFKIARDPALPPKRRSQGLSILERFVDPADPARGKERVALGEEINKKLSAAQQTDAQLADAAEVVAKLRPELSKCHATALKKTPGLSVKGQLALKIDVKGSVTEASAAGIEPADFRSCLEDAARRTKFAPTAQPTTLRVPLAFGATAS